MKYLLLFVFIFPYSVFGCSCVEVSLLDKIEKSDYVYVGKVVESSLKSNGEVLNNVEISKVYKGNPETMQILSFVPNGGTCDMVAAVGIEYLIFGVKGSVPTLAACSPTQSLYLTENLKIQELESLFQKKIEDHKPNKPLKGEATSGSL